VRFDSEAELLFEESVPAVPLPEGADLFIERLVADGGTNMAPALGLAMGLPRHDGLLRQIVFVTDGSVGNEQELLLQIAERLGESRLFTVSIGPAPNSWFMRKAAAIGRGSHSHIGRQEDVGERMAQLWARIENPALQNLCVDWGMEAEFYPEIIPDLYAGEPLWLYARLPFEPREVTVCGELEGQNWETTSTLSPAAGGEGLATLWARSKIEALEDSRIFGIDPAAVRRQVVDIALRFGLLTPYTSLVAVDRRAARPGAERLEAEQVPGLLPAGSTPGVGFVQTATGWRAQLALSLLSLSVAAGMLLFATPARIVHRSDAHRVPPPVPLLAVKSRAIALRGGVWHRRIFALWPALVRLGGVDSAQGGTGAVVDRTSCGGPPVRKRRPGPGPTPVPPPNWRCRASANACWCWREARAATWPLGPFSSTGRDSSTGPDPPREPAATS
jgi:hypothetical protein